MQNIPNICFNHASNRRDELLLLRTWCHCHQVVKDGHWMKPQAYSSGLQSWGCLWPLKNKSNLNCISIVSIKKNNRSTSLLCESVEWVWCHFLKGISQWVLQPEAMGSLAYKSLHSECIKDGLIISFFFCHTEHSGQVDQKDQPGFSGGNQLLERTVYGGNHCQCRYCPNCLCSNSWCRYSDMGPFYNNR